MESIYRRRSVRDYTAQKLEPTVIDSLLNAAVAAPTARHQEPWSFVVIQDKETLDRLSDSTKALVRTKAARVDAEDAKHLLHMADSPEFHVFHNAGPLIVICGKAEEPFVVADCWLAAENLMLAACAEDLGTCVIGFAVETLNTPQWLAELGVPNGITAIAPIIVGAPAGETASTSRKPPAVHCWK